MYGELMVMEKQESELKRAMEQVGPLRAEIFYLREVCKLSLEAIEALCPEDPFVTDSMDVVPRAKRALLRVKAGKTRGKAGGSNEVQG